MYFIIGLVIFFMLTIPTKKGKPMEWMKGISSHRGRFKQDQSIAENSMSAFNASLQENLDIEVDVRITKDNQLVMFHDRTLKRMCGVDLDVEVEILEILQQYPLGNSKDKIPTFKEMLELIGGKVNLLIEIKSTKRMNEVCEMIVNQLYSYEGNFAICSFDPKIVRWFKINREHYIRGQIIQSFLNDKKYNLFNRVILTINGYNFYTRADFVSVHYALAPYYRWMRLFYGFVCVWAVSDYAMFNQLKKRVDHVIVEFIDVKK
jgi:glycerophosphoryl diester phosphodiesterase